jgi:hypothetical protein
MKHKIGFWVLLIFFLCFIGFSLGAQELQTGAIRGKVVDENGQGLPGVSITVTGPALMGKSTAITNEQGLFRVPALPAGSNYEIRAELQGFETLIRKGIIIQLGQTVTIQLQMKPSAIKEEVVVTAPSPTVDVVKSVSSVSVTSEVLTSLPISRDIYSVFDLTPGTIGSSVYGGGWGEIGAVLDGVQMVEPDVGGIALGYDVGIAWDMVEEVGVLTTGAPAEYYYAGSGTTNILMKSGGNRMTGEFSLYYTNKHLSEIRLSDEELDALNMAKPSVPIYSYDASAALGGAIIKDRLWYMGEFRYIYSKDTGDFRPTVINGKQYTNYDRIFPNYIGYLKLTFQLAKNVRGSVMGHYSMEDVPYYYGGWNLTNEANWHNKPIRFNYAGNITWFLGKDTILDLRAGGLYFKWKGSYTKEADPNGPAFSDAYNGYQWGNPGAINYTWKPKVNIALTFTRFIDNLLGGDHEIKAGIEWERNRGDWGFYMKQPLWWTYYNGNPYYYRAQNNGQTDPVYGDGLLYYACIGETEGASYESGITSRIGGFVQDSLRIKRLTINAGVRFDTIEGWTPGRIKGATSDPVALAIGETYFKPIYGFNPYDEMAYPEWKHAFPFGLLISPRLGLTFDVFGNGKTALKASFNYSPDPGLSPIGTFSSAYPMHWVGFTFNWWDLNDNGVPDSPPIDKYEEAYGDTPLGMVSDAYKRSIDPNAKVPFISEFNVGLDHELVRDFKVGVHYIYKLRKNILDSVLWDENTGRYWYSYEKGQEWWIPFKTIVPAYGSYPAQEVTMYFLSEDAPDMFYRQTNIPEGRMNYRSFELSFTKRMSQGWSLGGSINFNKSKGNYSPGYATWAAMGTFSSANSFVNTYGDLTTRLVIKLYGTFTLPYKFLFSFIFQHYSGWPWGRGVTVDPPADWAAEHNVMTVPYYVSIEPPGTRWGKGSDSLDIRLQKDFTIGKGNLGFYVDIFNLPNTYTLDASIGAGGIWRPADENTSEGTFIRDWVGLYGFGGSRRFRFGFLYRF